MSPIERALSVALSAEATMLDLEREAEAAKWAAEQLRKGMVLPPAIQAKVYDARYASCLSLKADLLMFSQMSCDLAREIVALQEGMARLQAPRAPWWRRLFTSWRRSRSRPA